MEILSRADKISKIDIFKNTSEETSYVVSMARCACSITVDFSEEEYALNNELIFRKKHKRQYGGPMDDWDEPVHESVPIKKAKLTFTDDTTMSMYFR